jgi:hypothetical protein
MARRTFKHPQMQMKGCCNDSKGAMKMKRIVKGMLLAGVGMTAAALKLWIRSRPTTK